jgi:hypothetical protein
MSTAAIVIVAPRAGFIAQVHEEVSITRPSPLPSMLMARIPRRREGQEKVAPAVEAKMSREQAIEAAEMVYLDVYKGMSAAARAMGFEPEGAKSRIISYLNLIRCSADACRRACCSNTPTCSSSGRPHRRWWT